MKAAGITTWFQFTQGRCLFSREVSIRDKKDETILPFWPLFCRWFGYYFVWVWKRPHLTYMWM